VPDRVGRSQRLAIRDEDRGARRDSARRGRPRARADCHDGKPGKPHERRWGVGYEVWQCSVYSRRAAQFEYEVFAHEASAFKGARSDDFELPERAT